MTLALRALMSFSSVKGRVLNSRCAAGPTQFPPGFDNFVSHSVYKYLEKNRTRNSICSLKNVVLVLIK